MEKGEYNIKNLEKGLTLLDRQIKTEESKYAINNSLVRVNDATVDNIAKNTDLLSKKILSERVARKGQQLTNENLKEEKQLIIQEKLVGIAKEALYVAQKDNTDVLSIPSKNNNSHQHFCQCLCHHFGSFLGGVGAVGDVWVIVAEVAIFVAFYCAVEVWVYAAQIMHVEYWE